MSQECPEKKPKKNGTSKKCPVYRALGHRKRPIFSSILKFRRRFFFGFCVSKKSEKKFLFCGNFKLSKLKVSIYIKWPNSFVSNVSNHSILILLTSITSVSSEEGRILFFSIIIHADETIEFQKFCDVQWVSFQVFTDSFVIYFWIKFKFGES
jgi:hypothetical protein